MNWNKLKKELESFMTPSLVGTVVYRSAGYRYTPDKNTQCYISVHDKEVFNNQVTGLPIVWYETEQAVKNDAPYLPITVEELEAIRQKMKNVPEDRLSIIAKKNKLTLYAKEVIRTQNNLYKTDFQKTALTYLSKSVDQCLNSDDIILNILAIIDRRVGKKRIAGLSDQMSMKHPVVKYFYDLRRNA